jgi:hypothetical protein
MAKISKIKYHNANIRAIMKDDTDELLDDLAGQIQADVQAATDADERGWVIEVMERDTRTRGRRIIGTQAEKANYIEAHRHYFLNAIYQQRQPGAQ